MKTVKPGAIVHMKTSTFPSILRSSLSDRCGRFLAGRRKWPASIPAGVKAGYSQFFWPLAIAGFLSGCAETSTLVYHNPNFDQNKTYRIAVLPFRNAADKPGSGAALSSIFEATLLASGKAEVVERGALDRIMRERHPGRTESTNSDYAGEFEDPVALGKLVHADLVVVGNVTCWRQGHQWGLFDPQINTAVAASVKAVSVEKGLVVWSLDKSAEATLITDALEVDAPPDVVGRKLCRQMVRSFVGARR